MNHSLWVLASQLFSGSGSGYMCLIFYRLRTRVQVHADFVGDTKHPRKLFWPCNPCIGLVAACWWKM